MPTLGELAALVGGSVQGSKDLTVDGVATVEDAKPGQLTFVTDDKYLSLLESSRATAVLIAPGKPTHGKAAVLHPNPLAALPVLLARFAPAAPAAPQELIDRTAWIHPTARLGAGAQVGPYAVIEAGVTVGDRAQIGPLCVVAWGSRIGKETRLAPLVAIGERTVIGDRVLIHAGTVLGADGFGFLPGQNGPEKIPQIGRVVVEDEVEIGANCTIDRATVGDTVIQRAAKLDDQVHVAHNCVIGEGTLVAGQAAFSGSVKVGRGCLIGGQAGVGDHVTLGNGVQVAGGAGVHRDTSDGEKLFGYPARPAREALKLNAAVARLPKLLARIRELEKRVAELEQRGSQGG